MDWPHVQTAAPFLLIIGYLLVASVLKATASHIRKHIARHDRLLAARIRRLTYMREVELYRQRMEAVANQSSNVQVVDDTDEAANADPEASSMRRAA